MSPPDSDMCSLFFFLPLGTGQARRAQPSGTKNLTLDRLTPKISHTQFRYLLEPWTSWTSGEIHPTELSVSGIGWSLAGSRTG